MQWGAVSRNTLRRLEAGLAQYRDWLDRTKQKSAGQAAVEGRICRTRDLPLFSRRHCATRGRADSSRGRGFLICGGALVAGSPAAWAACRYDGELQLATVYVAAGAEGCFELR